MTQLGNGLYSADRLDDALSVEEANLAMMRRIGASEEHILNAQGNLSNTYAKMKRFEQAIQMDRDVYYGSLKLDGEEHERTITAATCYANSLNALQRFEEAKALLNKSLPVARRVLGEIHHLTLRMQLNYARTLYENPAATLDDLREAVNTLDDTKRTARRVLGGAHPVTGSIEKGLQQARESLGAFAAP